MKWLKRKIARIKRNLRVNAEIARFKRMFQ
jgi:hypothetical protein